MDNPWLDIPLADYEAHMALPEVAQAELLARELEGLVRAEPAAAVAVLGCSGGNGLTALAGAGVERLVAVDLNAGYVAATVARHGARFARFEAHVADVLDPALAFAPVDLAFAGLLLEYVDVASFMARVARWLRPGGRLGVVLQLASQAHGAVTPSPHRSLASLAAVMQLREPAAVAADGEAAGLRVASERRVPLATGKAFAILVFRAPDPSEAARDAGEDFDRAYAATPALFGDAPERLLVTHVGEIPRGGLALDVGAGQGRHALFLARDGFRVDALDPSAEALAAVSHAAAAAGLGERIATIRGGFDAVRAPEGGYAAVLLFGLVPLLEWREIARLQSAVGRWLAPGGLCLLTAFTSDDPGHAGWAAAGRAIGPHSYLRPDGTLRTFLAPGQAPSLFPDLAIEHHWEGLGAEHRHGDGAPERHALVELVARRLR